MKTIMDIKKEILSGLDKIKQEVPLIHHITNYVVMNDCANITLHIGASPVMAHAPEEVEEMVSIASGLVLNIGTLTLDTVDTMIKAGKKANERNIPVLLDPVGAGATSMRTNEANRILDSIKVDIIKGNAGEISTLAGFDATVKGVDSVETSSEPYEIVETLAKKRQTCVVITGINDWVSDGCKTFCVKNGHINMSKVVGMGCMVGSVITSFASVMEDMALAAVSGLVSMGISAELAAEKGDKPATYKRELLDSIYMLDKERIMKYTRVEYKG